MTDQLSVRVARIIEEYSAQGIHRTGTATDKASGEWLAANISELGVTPDLERFEFERVQPLDTALLIGQQRFEGVPLYDCMYTGPEGITGKLGELGSHADIGIIRMQPRSSPAGQTLNEARHKQLHKALIAVTDPRLPASGVATLNAEHFSGPFGPPVLQLANDSWLALQEAAKRRSSVKLTVHCERTVSEAMNVAAGIKGSDSGLPQLVIMTPRSGWWQCASERGGGIACFLEMVSAIKVAGPRRDVLFTANTGHELDHLGLDRYLEANSSLIKGALLWIHLGANFAAAYNPGVRLQYSDQHAKALTEEFLNRTGIQAAIETPIEQRPFGEARNIFDGGGRYISILGGNGLFHHPKDTWPRAVNLAETSRWIRAFTDLAVALSR
ncbi:MAG: hypothetical protein QGI68_01810 [Pseudomonadales bacterium]|jgi:hypothetical protein|nr:hypothetical protein [Pseudomonadales bacterium]MDP7145694.1 hypothetical protein [Pseudomonadales bacterium]MDP7360830.1 hypothetical protein [Pseudomonadales bacterium]MDP7594290.1 hypothetical protein [Pseudomonadales bacterium]HJN51989.1 hypothetical protein [Pseudomonadales bacterium]|tara:strand:+ start:4115 stop:5269 length:1155 start_codon:yes stop_codon:yes gene_type:complete